MANQEVIGKGRGYEYHLINEYVANLQKELNIHRLRSKWIEIKFVDDVNGNMGDCTGDTDEVEIRIDRTLSWNDQRITLAHEMVHAEQFLRANTVSEVYADLLEDKLFKTCYPEHALEYSNT